MALGSIIHRAERYDELCQDTRDMRARIDGQDARIDRLERLLVDTINALDEARQQLGARAGAPVQSSRVDIARADPAKKARTIYVALADEMGGSPSDRTLVSMVARLDAESHAQFEARGLLGPQENATTSHALALWLSEPTAGPNVWHSPTTRRIHKALDHLGIKPARRA